jgi:hypothetical protein
LTRKVYQNLVGKVAVAFRVMDTINVQLMIRVVNAFRHGLDSQQLQNATSNPNIQRVLQKQVSLGKRMSTTSVISEQSDHSPHPGPPIVTTVAQSKAQDMQSMSHTETAV